jgi:DNA-binding transcriptional LysR family regulator
MRQPSVTEMNAFVAVAQQKSFAKAALQLGVSRSGLSETISVLETRLGVRLLNRTTRSVSLTHAGERVLAKLRPLLDELTEVFETINTFRDKPAGLLRLTVPPPVSRFMLEPMVARFLAQYPEIELEISVDSALTDVVAGRFDAGMRAGERVERDMIAVRVDMEMRYSVVASLAYLKRRGRPAVPGDLERHDCIRARFPSGLILPWVFEKKGKRIEVAVTGRLTVNNETLARRAALDGVGVLYSATSYVAADVAAGRLVSLLEDWQPAPTQIFLYYPSRHQVPAPLQAFIEFMRKEAKEMEKPRAEW